MASRYTSYDSRSSTSSYFSDPSSSVEFQSSTAPPSIPSRAIVKSNANRASPNLTSMVKKFMDRKPTSSATSALVRAKGLSKKPAAGALVIPADFIAEDLKKTARKGTGLMGLQKKLFGKEKEKKKEKEVKALVEVKGNGNTRTLAMVLRSERELLAANKELELQLSQLNFMLENKNTEVEKLKDLCLKQREEIKALKNAILFPDVMNSQLQEILEKQGSELKQAKQLIPTLQRQVTSLTGQLQCLADDLAEVKADKYSRASARGHDESSRKPSYDHEEAANSLEFSSCDGATPGSPDDMLIKDLNPCLTPYYAKTKSKEFDGMGYDSPPPEETSSENNASMYNELSCCNSRLGKLSKSSDGHKICSKGSMMAGTARRSDGSNRGTLRKQMHQKNYY